jgi:hypothetical protein
VFAAFIRRDRGKSARNAALFIELSRNVDGSKPVERAFGSGYVRLRDDALQRNSG